MGLDWNPANKPIPGREAEFKALRAELDAEAAAADANESEEETEASKRFFAASVSAFDTLSAPTIGVDEVADRWLKEQYESQAIDEPFDVWFARLRGLRVVHLVPDCPGIPRYSNGSVAGYVEPFSFRAQFLTLCEDIIGSEALERCYQSMTAAELIEFGKFLKEAGESHARQHGVSLPSDTDEFDEEAPEWKADILVAAGEWCVFWGERGHSLDPYW